LSGPRRLLLRYLSRQAQKFIGLREYMKAVLITGIAEVKKEINTLSRRFAADGSISEPSDIFFLTKDEVEVIMEGRVGEIQVESVVARRRREHERNQTVAFPGYSNGRPRPLSSKELELESGFEVLRGLAVSPGKVTGKARVITDPRRNAIIKPGEILVAPVTDAAWTPLFVTAGAIVVDVGGPLSHGSIVAREYGIPGVLSVGLATRLIKTGQVITVDGDHGRVYLHPQENES
jgi:pyruvate,water dikinase